MPRSTLIGRVAVLIALAAAVAVAVVLAIDGGDDYEVTARFENASQLVTGNEVTVGGTSVGSVEEIELGENGEALVTFTVADELAPLRRGTEATIRSPSLASVAARKVQLTLPGEGTAGREIPDGGVLTQEETVSAVDLDELFNTLDRDTVADLKKVIRGFADSYDGVGQQANRGFRFLNPFLSTSRRVFAELTRDELALQSLIVDADQLTGALASRRDDLSQLVGNTDEMMAALASRREQLATAISRLPAFMRRANTTFVNLRAALGDLDPLVDASKPLATELEPFLAELRAASRNLVPATEDLGRAIERPGAGNDLIELTEAQPALTKRAVGPLRRNGESRRGAFPESTEALTDSLQQLSFFRPYTTELVAWFDDFGHSGAVDAAGGFGRISTTFNPFTVSAPGGIPIIDPLPPIPIPGTEGGPLTPQEQLDLLDLGNTRRCPGANERPAPDGSNPFTDGGALNCDPSQIPPGS